MDIKHTNAGAIGHRLVITYTDEERGTRSDQAMIADAEKQALAHCRKADHYPKLSKTDPRRLISHGMRAKPDADGVIRRFTIWVRPWNRQAEPSPWSVEPEYRKAEATS